MIGALTATSRSAWSFSRDGGIPLHHTWQKVNKRFEVPLNALLLAVVIDALLGLIYLGSDAAFRAFTGGEPCRFRGLESPRMTDHGETKQNHDSGDHLSRCLVHGPHLDQLCEAT